MDSEKEYLRIRYLEEFMKTLFVTDLDGTLLNTIDDLATSTNYALQCAGYPQHDLFAYRYFVGNGINKLIETSRTFCFCFCEFFLHSLLSAPTINSTLLYRVPNLLLAHALSS